MQARATRGRKRKQKLVAYWATIGPSLEEQALHGKRDHTGLWAWSGCWAFEACVSWELGLIWANKIGLRPRLGPNQNNDNKIIMKIKITKEMDNNMR